MSIRTESQLSTQLQALRVDPPDDGFSMRLSARLAEATPAGRSDHRGKVVSLRKFRGNRSTLMLLAAATVFVAGGAAALGGPAVVSEWIASWTAPAAPVVPEVQPAPVSKPAANLRKALPKTKAVVVEPAVPKSATAEATTRLPLPKSIPRVQGPTPQRKPAVVRRAAIAEKRAVVAPEVEPQPLRIPRVVLGAPPARQSLRERTRAHSEARSRVRAAERRAGPAHPVVRPGQQVRGRAAKGQHNIRAQREARRRAVRQQRQLRQQRRRQQSRPEQKLDRRPN